MDEKPKRIVLDTNILVSDLLYGGKPEIILKQAIEKHFFAVYSPDLLSELLNILTKKFHFSKERLIQTETKVKKAFRLVYPTKTINVLKDEPDNRVLETAQEGECHYIITGDKELLKLKSFKDTKILTASQFLKLLK